LVATDPFVSLATMQGQAWGWNVPIARVAHPVGGILEADLAGRADQVAAFVIEQTAAAARVTAARPVAIEDRVEAPSDPEAFLDFVQLRGWGDGLPVLLPTLARVTRMLAAHSLDAAEVVGRIPPRNARITLREVAVNAVMAGCPDEAFPVLLAAIRAALVDSFGLLGVLATTHPCTVGVVVSGPVVDRLGINYGSSLYGPGNRMNASIGRAVRLSLMNLGGATLVTVDKSSQGSAGKYSFCFAESQLVNPWPPHHVERGFEVGDSCVTVAAFEGPHNIHEPTASTGEEMMRFLVAAMSSTGHNNIMRRGDLFLVLGPEHAALLARDGWDRKRIRERLWAEAGTPARNVADANYAFINENRRQDAPPPDRRTGRYELSETPEQIRIVVAGGPGKHSSWLPTFGLTYSSTAKL
jgi:hypothetical protein